MFEDADTLWVVHIGNDDRIALKARDEGFVCIGWTKMGDLSQYPTREEMKAAMKRTWPSWSKGSVRSSYGQPYRFAHEMEEGDPIVFPVSPTSEIAIGRISGPYRWADDDQDLVENDYCNVRPVEWLEIVPRTVFTQPALHSFGAFQSVSTSNDHLEEVTAVLDGEMPSEGEDEAEEGGDGDGDEVGAGSNLYEIAIQETEDTLLKGWQSTGHAFESVVAAVFEALGYTTEVTQASADHGIDVIAHPDPLGMEQPYIKIQVKSGKSPVPESDVNQLKGLLHQNEQGVLVSLGGFRRDAESIARASPNVTLVGPKKFVRLFLDHYDDLDPAWRAKYPLKRVFVPFS